jgi:succinate dehydrogenase/fumarate reductase flavoprotein subunit
MNLLARKPTKAIGRIGKRVIQGLGGMALGREYMAGGQALAAGLFAGTIAQDIPIWTNTELVELIIEDGRVVGVRARQHDRTVTIHAERGVVLAAGGFDHNMTMRHEHQSPRLVDHMSLGADGNTGDSITIAGAAGAQTQLMAEAWWFPAFAPVEGTQPGIMLAERAMPGSLVVDQRAQRFVNEATDYMSFGQRILELEDAGTPVTDMWFVFDQTYKNRYVIGGAVFPRAPIPDRWYEAGVAHRGDSVAELAGAIGLPADALEKTIGRFNELASNGIDDDFGRGASRYDQYYGDPTNVPNPNLRPLTGNLYAIKVVLSDLGTCGGIVADERARVLTADGSPLPGLYAVGNNAANAFGRRYPGAGATIGQGLVYGYIAAHEAAGR